MSLKLDCPRCKTHLQVPDRMAGGYVNCPRCKGRVWVAKDAPVEAVAESVPIATPIVAAPAGPRGPVVPAISPVRATPGAMTPAMPATPPVPAPAKKIARFIAADAADSTLRLAADGKLPELQLDEGKRQPKQQSETRSVNPLVLFGALGISVVLSIVLALTDVGSPLVSDDAVKAQARQTIEDQYFGSGTLDSRQLEPYQVLLREAQRAYSRRDYKTQRENYRKVLDMLRAERGTEEKGLTGSRTKDKTLEEAISVLLSGT
jgi:hypothetical protein